MDTQKTTTGGPWTDRDEWLRQFDEELRSLRQHPTEDFVLTIAYAFHGDEDPRAAAREYDQQIKSAAKSGRPD